MSGSCANNAPSCGFEELAQKLEGAVLHTMNPSVDNSARHQAYQMLEQAKEDPSVSIPCGFLLSVNTRPSIVRHVGLHLLEINIKYKWNQLSMEDKESIKVNTMALLSSHQNAGPEESFIQDKISRLVVELAKHTWPQLWPSFMEELHECALLGPKKTETVLLVITRLSEDVAVLQTVECSKRRRELYQCLAGGMSETFEWLLRLLGQHYNPGSHVNLSLLKGVLQCLTSLVEWVAVQHLFSDSAKLLHMLCCLLNDDNLKLHAAQCLLAVNY
ncbi:hypothetical protein HAZT_HAZT008727 [Hyalella azteca]|uniref:Importin N-terminal domain-containing protein n=1 Tax=Hyalella azteca TaxID=294128 RepID=A0A6A0H5U8_HYAAZ|nr:hypothetical protein HAZT_HAZT008727 [Hyalella azteca]